MLVKNLALLLASAFARDCAASKSANVRSTDSIRAALGITTCHEYYPYNQYRFSVLVHLADGTRRKCAPFSQPKVDLIRPEYNTNRSMESGLKKADDNKECY